jgi:hypothetical protein
MGILSSSRGCPAKPGQVNADLIVGTLTFRHLLRIIGWVCFGVTLVIWSVLALTHLRQYRIPNEQRQIFRITLTPMIFTVVAVISIHSYNAAEYLEPLANLYEAWALTSLFLLYVHYIVPKGTTKEVFFDSVLHAGKGEAKSSLKWFWVRLFLTGSFVVADAKSCLSEYLARCLFLWRNLYNPGHHPGNHPSHRLLLRDIIEAKACSYMGTTGPSSFSWFFATGDPS